MKSFHVKVPEYRPEHVGVCIRLAEDTSTFFAEASRCGYKAGRSPEKRGMTFCSGSETGSRFVTILLNLAKIDLEIITHEVRHAISWLMSDKDGLLVVNLMDEAQEEAFGRRMDLMTGEIVAEAQRLTGRALTWL